MLSIEGIATFFFIPDGKGVHIINFHVYLLGSPCLKISLACVNVLQPLSNIHSDISDQYVLFKLLFCAFFKVQLTLLTPNKTE